MIISKARSTNTISSVFLVMFFWWLNFGVVLWEASAGFLLWNDFPFLKVAISQLSILSTALLINYTLQKNKFVGIGDSIGGVVFLIFCLGIPKLHLYYTELMSLLIIIFSNLRLIGIHNTIKNYLREFEVGILFGVALVLSPSFLLIPLMLLIGIALVVSFTWRDFIVPLFGFLFVFLTKLVVFYFINESDYKIFLPLYFSYPQFDVQFKISQILIIIIIFFELFVLIRLFSVIEKKSIKERVYYWLWIWTTIFMSFSLIFFQETFNKFVLILILAAPCSIFSIEYFPKKRKFKGWWRKELILYFLIFTLLSIRII